MTYKNPKKEVVEEASMIIDSFLSEHKGQFEPSREREMESLKAKLELLTLCPCTTSPEDALVNAKKIKPKGEKKLNERNKFMSKCMLSSEKGGYGKNMKSCSDDWTEAKKTKS